MYKWRNGLWLSSRRRKQRSEGGKEGGISEKGEGRRRRRRKSEKGIGKGPIFPLKRGKKGVRVSRGEYVKVGENKTSP